MFIISRTATRRLCAQQATSFAAPSPTAHVASVLALLSLPVAPSKQVSAHGCHVVYLDARLERPAGGEGRGAQSVEHAQEFDGVSLAPTGFGRDKRLTSSHPSVCTTPRALDCNLGRLRLVDAAEPRGLRGHLHTDGHVIYPLTGLE